MVVSQRSMVRMGQGGTIDGGSVVVGYFQSLGSLFFISISPFSAGHGSTEEIDTSSGLNFMLVAFDFNFDFFGHIFVLDGLGYSVSQRMVDTIGISPGIAIQGRQNNLLGLRSSLHFITQN